ncbi:MAG: GHKL domain-containing protein [Lachnospiraceae bacterium]|nr:GHKL domain-containing protein [Lachnospiraceae bacterium]
MNWLEIGVNFIDSIIVYDSKGYIEVGLWWIILLLLIKSIYIGVTELILHNQVKDKVYVSNKIYMKLNIVAFSLLIVFNFFRGFTYRNSLNDNIIHDVELLFFFLIISDITIYVLFINLANTRIRLMKEQMKAAAYEYRVSNVQAMKEMHHQSEKINHDIKSKLLNIRVMVEAGKIEEVKKYLDETLKVSMSVKKIVVTENLLLDAVLNHHLDICETKNINSKIEVNCVIEPHMETDVAVMMTNLLANAVEAAEKTNEKIIEILVSRKSDYLYVLVKNSFDGVLKKHNEKLLTIKDEKNLHGYGLINVKDIVRKYDGIYEYAVEDKEFCTKIMLYAK